MSHFLFLSSILTFKGTFFPHKIFTLVQKVSKKTEKYFWHLSPIGVFFFTFESTAHQVYRCIELLRKINIIEQLCFGYTVDTWKYFGGKQSYVSWICCSGHFYWWYFKCILTIIVYLLRQLFPYRPTNMMKSAHPGRLILNSPPGQLRINRPG